MNAGFSSISWKLLQAAIEVPYSKKLLLDRFKALEAQPQEH
jgi:hypothetical protein